MLIKFRKLPFSLLLLAVAALSYAPFFWERGFYWDEVPWVWIYFRLGSEALTQTFSTSRPFWGMLYQTTLPLLGPEPWHWHLALIFFRFLTAYLFYLLIKKIWPSRPFLTHSSPILFLVYPGLSQNFLGLMYTHFYLVLCLFLLSFLFTARAIHHRQFWWHIPGLILSIANILMLEYFYFLELLRPLFIWNLMGRRRSDILDALRQSWVYLVSFFIISLWRIFFFTNQNASYSYGTLEALKESPFAGISELIKMVLVSFWNTNILVWFRSLEIFILSETGVYTLIGSLVIGVITAAILFLNKQTFLSEKNSYSDLFIALMIWLFSGGAFWLVGSRTLPLLHFSSDRFMLPFMLGSSLLISLTLSTLRSENLRRFLLIIIVSFASAWQFSVNRDFIRDKEEHDRFFSQLVQRIPSIPVGTTIITNDLPLTYYSDNSLSGTLNWLYSRPGEMDTILYFASVRSQEGRSLEDGFEPGIEFEQNYLATIFHGTTSQVLVFEYSPPACLRLLDPEIDSVNKLLPPDLRDAALLSVPELAGKGITYTIPGYLEQKTNPWCDLYQKASLAAVDGDWEYVMELFESAKNNGLEPQSPMENLIFIEGAAYLGDWDTATQLTNNTYLFSKSFTSPTLCVLWDRINRNISDSEQRDSNILSIMNQLGCSER